MLLLKEIIFKLRPNKYNKNLIFVGGKSINYTFAA